MPANQYGIDMGEIYRTTAAVKGQRAQNKMAGMKIDEAKAKTERRNLLSLSPNDKGAQEQFILSGGSPQMISQLNSLTAQEKAQKAAESQELVQRSGWVLDSANEEQFKERWGQATQGIRPELFKDLPAIESPEFAPAARDLLTNAFSMSKSVGQYLESIKPAGELKQFDHAGESVIHQGGKIVERKDKTDKGGAKGGVTPAQQLQRDKFAKSISDTNQKNLYKDIAGLAGAKMSPDGTYIMFNKNNAKWNQAMTLGLKYLAEGKYKSTTEAALQAAKKYGLVTDAQLAEKIGDAPADPLGLL